MLSFIIQTLNGLASASLLFIAALGLTLIFGVTRIVNFAHGSFAMLGAYMAISANTWLGGGVVGFWGGALLSAACVALLAAGIEVLILRRIYSAPPLLQLITTFGVVLVVKDAALYLWGPEDLLGPRAPGLRGAIAVFGQPFPAYDLFLILAGPALLAAVWLLLTRTDYGTKVRAATEDRDMASALGVNQALLFTSIFAIGCFLAGLAGALALPREPANLTIDLGLIAEVFVVTVVGGLGSIPGAYIAAVIIGIAKAWCIGIGTVTLFGIDVAFPKLTLVTEFLVMAAVLIVRPWGLFGTSPPPERSASSVARPLSRFEFTPRWAFVCGAMLLAAVPLAAGQYTLVLLTDVIVFALFAASLGLLMGAGGMASFGHAAYFGAGAYAAAIAAKAGGPFLFALAAGFLSASALAFAFGWFVVRLDGIPLAMLTLALAQITWAVAFQWDAVTGGSNGLFGVWPPAMLASKQAYYLFSAALIGAAIVFLWRLPHTAFGFQLRAARDSRLRAEAVGIDTRRLQWMAFTFAGALAGFAGSVYVFSKGSLSPDVLSIPRSVDGLVMVLLGGVGTLTGPVAGAAAFTLLQDWVTRATPYWHAALGIFIVLLTLLFPAGIVGTLRQRWADRGDA